MTALKKYKPLLPVALLTLLCIWTLLQALKGTVEMGDEVSDFSLNIRHLLALLLTAACYIIYFYRHRYYPIILFITLLTGLLNVVYFTPYEIFLSMRLWFIVPLKVHPLIAAILLITFVIFLGGRKAPHADVYIPDAEAIDDFKERYLSYDSERLQEIMRENRYVPEAIEAARQVLQERDKPADASLPS